MFWLFSFTFLGHAFLGLHFHSRGSFPVATVELEFSLVSSSEATLRKHLGYSLVYALNLDLHVDKMVLRPPPSFLPKVWHFHLNKEIVLLCVLGRCTQRGDLALLGCGLRDSMAYFRWFDGLLYATD